MLCEAQGMWGDLGRRILWERERPSRLQTYEWVRYTGTATCSLSCSIWSHVDQIWTNKPSPSQIPASLNCEQNKMVVLNFVVVYFTAIANQNIRLNHSKELKYFNIFAMIWTNHDFQPCFSTVLNVSQLCTQILVYLLFLPSTMNSHTIYPLERLLPWTKTLCSDKNSKA